MDPNKLTMKSQAGLEVARHQALALVFRVQRRSA